MPRQKIPSASSRASIVAAVPAPNAMADAISLASHTVAGIASAKTIPARAFRHTMVIHGATNRPHNSGSPNVTTHQVLRPAGTKAPLEYQDRTAQATPRHTTPAASTPARSTSRETDVPDLPVETAAAAMFGSCTRVPTESPPRATVPRKYANNPAAPHSAAKAGGDRHRRQAGQPGGRQPSDFLPPAGREQRAGRHATAPVDPTGASG